jgi:hypothetical protein
MPDIPKYYDNQDDERVTLIIYLFQIQGFSKFEIQKDEPLSTTNNTHSNGMIPPRSMRESLSWSYLGAQCDNICKSLDGTPSNRRSTVLYLCYFGHDLL